ncbi:MAG: radical SAM protein [Candidatus Saelkia tenebricola]|nr:radical SAM protein [Candidatus Saelkia tenebricola]
MQFGISYISSFLQKYGHRTNLLVLSRLFGRKNTTLLKEYMSNFNPQLICFTAVASEYRFIADIARYIKRHYPHVYLLIGGVHATLNPEEVLLDDFDALCIGEGEKPTLEVVEQLKKKQLPSSVSNIWVKNGSDVEKNLPREFMQKLDDLPFPDRGMWQKWMKRAEPERVSILLSRGCPFSCSYCCNHALRKITQGAYVRHRSPDNIVKEINQILIEFPTIKELYLEVETITSNMDWCLRLCAELTNLNSRLKQPLSFGANIRPTSNANFDILFSVFRKANFRFINIGLESGSEKLRRETLRRNYSNDDIINCVKLARKHGLQVCFFNLIGIPGETLADIKETIEINRICKPDWDFTSIFFPYPGTALHSICKRQGLLKKNLDTRKERQRAVLDMPGLSRREIQRSFKFFHYYVDGILDPNDKRLSWILLLKLAVIDCCKKVYKRMIRTPFLKNLLLLMKNYLKTTIKK